MSRISKFPVAVLGVLAALAGPSSAQSQQPDRVHVITSGGFTAAFNVLGPIFEEASGIEIDLEYGSSTGGGPESIPVRLERGETFDVLIFNGSAINGVASTGGILPESRVELGRSVVGMAVRSGAPIPDISTREAFVETLLAAESIGYSASVSGTYLSTVVFSRAQYLGRDRAQVPAHRN